MPIETRPWDIADSLDRGARIALYLEAVFEDGDAALIAAALGDVARARGMSEVAKSAGLSRESLYRALGPNGNPEFGTIPRVVKALGARLTAVPVSGR